MRYLTLSLFFVALLLLGLSTEAQAQLSNCERALGEANLDINNVRARIPGPSGGLFYRGEPHVYEIPKGSGSNAIFASGIWVGGQVGGQLRVAATRYGEWEFWAGPLNENGVPPADCSIYDHVFKVSRAQIEEYEATGAAPPDMRNWPTGLGAPTLAPRENGIDDDGDGEIDEEGELVNFDITVPLAQRVNRKIDLAGGERPAILGDQSLWWVMNDRGNTHESSDSPAIGLEVHGLAFAFNTAGDIGNTTFYKYNLFYKGNVPLEGAYMGIFSDPDLGDAGDDYVGSDTTLGIGYVYNADNDDTGGEGYGSPPPAAGYDFFQGPIVPSLGDTAHVSGRAVPDFKNLKMTHFVFYNNGGGVTEDPQTASDYYNYMQGNWKDGKKITFGGNGRDFSNIPTDFMYTGDPATNTGWSERNPAGDGTLPPISAGDRRFVLSTGPFTINPGDQQEIIFGVVWAKGADNWASVETLRQADALAQAAFDVNFELPAPPAAPVLTATQLDGQIILEWENSSRSNNYLESYRESDPFAPDESKDYVFEGYDVLQFADAADLVGKVIATYDVPNGVTRVIDGIPGEPTGVTATGTDAGVQRFHVIGSLTNYKTYHYGVQAYAYNEPSFPKVYRGPISRLEVTPSRGEDILSDAALVAAGDVAEPDITGTKVGIGEGRVWADVVNPAKVTGETYTVEFYEIEVAGQAARVLEENLNEPDLQVLSREGLPVILPPNKTAAGTAITYNVKRGSTVVFDGAATGAAAPQRENIVNVDGLQLSIVGPAPGMKGFAAISNAAGPLDPWDMGTFAFNSNGFPMLEANGVIPEGSHPSPDRPTMGLQQSTNSSAWGIAVGGGNASYGDESGPFNTGSSWVGRSIRETWVTIGSDNYEWRFTQRCADGIDGNIVETDCLAWRAFNDGLIVEVPFEIWNVGTTDDPSDDYRLLPAICEEACFGDGSVEQYNAAGYESFKFDIGSDHPVSGGDNDPYSDWIYMYKPQDNGAAPGEQGYVNFFFGDEGTGDRTFSRQVLVNWNGGSERPYNAELPEIGTTFRYITLKPSQPGDIFTLSTEGLGAQAPDAATQEARLEDIYIVPNPYKGASVYERSQLIDEVRFTNLPEEATIRVFTLNGVLIRTIRKQGPDRFLKWNLTTEDNFPIASGMYLVHIDVPGVGERVIKFGVVKKRLELNAY